MSECCLFLLMVCLCKHQLSTFRRQSVSIIRIEIEWFTPGVGCWKPIHSAEVLRTARCDKDYLRRQIHAMRTSIKYYMSYTTLAYVFWYTAHELVIVSAIVNFAYTHSHAHSVSLSVHESSASLPLVLKGIFVLQSRELRKWYRSIFSSSRHMTLYFAARRLWRVGLAVTWLRFEVIFWARIRKIVN